MREDRFQLLNLQSTGASFNSNAISLDHIVLYSIQILLTGAPVGTFTLQCSNDNVVWDTITGSSLSVTSSGSNIWDVSDVSYQWVRLVYTRSSGSGSCTAWVKLKGV